METWPLAAPGQRKGCRMLMFGFNIVKNRVELVMVMMKCEREKSQVCRETVIHGSCDREGTQGGKVGRILLL